MGIIPAMFLPFGRIKKDDGEAAMPGMATSGLNPLFPAEIDQHAHGYQPA